VDRFTRRFGFKVAAALGAAAATGGLRSIAFAEKVPVGEPADIAEATVGGDLFVRVVELGDNMDPAKTAALQSGLTLRLVGDTLIAKDFDGNFVPHLATAWEISEDGLTWTFTLRDDVTFHDGTPLDAEAVRFTFDRILNPDTAAGSAAAQVGPMVRESLKAIDATTFQFQLSEPFAPLVQFLTGPSLGIVSPTAVEADPEGFARKPVMSGPYIFEEWREGDRVILRRNPDYAWAPDYLHQEPAGAFIESITFQSIVEDAAATAAFEAGEVHQLPIPSADIPRLEESGQYSIVSYQTQGIQFFAFNITRDLFADQALRFALMGAINKQDVLDAAIEGYGMPAYTYLSPAVNYYDTNAESYAPAYDPEAVKATLAELGWTDSDGDGVVDKDGVKLAFTALCTPEDPVVRAAQIMQAQFADVGVAMEISQMEFATLLEQVGGGQHEAAYIGYSYPDADFAYQLFHSSQATGGISFTQIQDPALDALIEQGRTQTNSDERAATYAEIQKYVNDQGLIIPLWVESNYLGFNPSVKGAALHPDTYTVYYDAWLAE
jgi:peptide/nickel transport system substrate-binding protein